MKRSIRALTALAAFAVFAIVSAWSFSAPVQAADDPAAGYYGNTIHCSGSFWDCRIWFNPDHTYFSIAHVVLPGRGPRPMFNMEEGTWEIKGENLCRQPKDKPDPKDNTCNFPQLNMHELNRKVGDKWTGVARDGSEEHFELLAGHR